MRLDGSGGAEAPEYSIVIPTFNRMDTLGEVLSAVAAQVDAPRYEVIVVNDGSSDGTREFLDARPPCGAASGLRILHQANRGPAAARNAGVDIATARWVAFLGDDTVPKPGWLAAHHEAHSRFGGDPKVAVIGYTGWHPRMSLTPFLRYINEHGLQFGYALIDKPDEVPFNFFYTSNLSLSRELLKKEPFDLRFPYAAWEDIEASYRLRGHGLRLVYSRAAVTAHDHPTSLKRFASRQEKAGYCAVVFHSLHPELGPFLGLGPDGPPPLPAGLPQWFAERAARLLEPLPVSFPRLWENVLRYHYIRGLHRGWEAIHKSSAAADG